ncbi:MAG TPA: DCC1-like thiol-disulfide oxidoreductase family protein [Candidatus Polarisedimenticolia bacterium]|nr:DCC1-like thiol-disulfide oxidoreductase family protein [Candidatus Polarisedimenticolia bacterium]
MLTSPGVHSSSGWTGGQYSVCRALLGLTIVLRIVSVVATWQSGWDATGSGAAIVAGLNVAVLVLAAGAFAAALLFAAGWRDRLMAVLLLLLLPIVVVLAGTPVSPGGWGVAWLLLTHLAIPAAPYGSWEARGRTDPRGPWRMPAALPWLHRLAFVTLAVVLFSRGARAFDLAVAFILALLAFDPGWIPGSIETGTNAARARDARRRMASADPDTLFYDGTCGLCHGAVRFFLAEDATGPHLRFGTLQGKSFHRAVPAQERTALPDSLVLVTRSHEVLTRSRGVFRALAELGGYWRVLAGVSGVLPVRLADAAYDAVARVRHRLFRRPEEACPLVPEDLRGRFLPD